MPFNPNTGGPEMTDLCEFQDSQSYMVSPCLPLNSTNKTKKTSILKHLAVLQQTLRNISSGPSPASHSFCAPGSSFAIFLVQVTLAEHCTLSTQPEFHEELSMVVLAPWPQWLSTEGLHGSLRRVLFRFPSPPWHSGSHWVRQKPF